MQSRPFSRAAGGQALRNRREKPKKGRNSIAVCSAQAGSVTSHPPG